MDPEVLLLYSEERNTFTNQFGIILLSIKLLGPTQPPIQWVLGAFSPGVKRQGREADHSPPTGAEVKTM
jgi:hypothetical protein